MKDEIVITLDDKNDYDGFVEKIRLLKPFDIDEQLRNLTGTHDYPHQFIPHFLKMRGDKELDDKMQEAGNFSKKARLDALMKDRGQINKEGAFSTIIIPNKGNPLFSKIVKIQRSQQVGPGYGALGGFLEDEDDGDIRPGREWAEELGELVQAMQAQGLNDAADQMDKDLRELAGNIEYTPLYTSHDDTHYAERGWGFKVDAHAHIAKINDDFIDRAQDIFERLEGLGTVNAAEVDGLKLIDIEQLPDIITKSFYPHEAMNDIIAIQIQMMEAGYGEKPFGLQGGQNMWDYLNSSSAGRRAIDQLSQKMMLKTSQLESLFNDVIDLYKKGQLGKPGLLPVTRVNAAAYADTFYNGIFAKDIKPARNPVNVNQLNFDDDMIHLVDHTKRFILPVPNESVADLKEPNEADCRAIGIAIHRDAGDDRPYYYNNKGDKHYCDSPLQRWSKEDDCYIPVDGQGIVIWNDQDKQFVPAQSGLNGDNRAVIIINHITDDQATRLQSKIDELDLDHIRNITEPQLNDILDYARHELGLDVMYNSDEGYVKQELLPKDGSVYGLKAKEGNPKKAVYVSGPAEIQGIDGQSSQPFDKSGGIVVELSPPQGNTPGTYSVFSVESPSTAAYKMLGDNGTLYDIDISHLVETGQFQAIATAAPASTKARRSLRR